MAQTNAKPTTSNCTNCFSLNIRLSGKGDRIKKGKGKKRIPFPSSRRPVTQDPCGY